MVRIPASWRGAIATPAGLGNGGLIGARRIPSDPQGLYTNLITVDLGNDGVAQQATFNSGGQAWAFAGPYGIGQTWNLDQCNVSTSVGQLDAAQASVYVGPYMQPFQPVAQYLIMQGLSGGGQQFGMGGTSVPQGWFVMAFWTGGTTGALAYLRLTGTKTALSR